MESIEKILPRSLHSLGPIFEIQFVRHWILNHLDEILQLPPNFLRNIHGEKFEYKRIFLSIPSAVYRDQLKFYREQILESINAFAVKKFAVTESIVDEVIFNAKPIHKTKIEPEKFSKLNGKNIRACQKKIFDQEKLRHEIRSFLLQKPFAFFNEVHARFPNATAKIFQRSRSELIHTLARKLTWNDQNSSDARILTMLYLQIPAEFVTANKIRKAFFDLRYNLAKDKF